MASAAIVRRGTRQILEAKPNRSGNSCCRYYWGALSNPYHGSMKPIEVPHLLRRYVPIPRNVRSRKSYFRPSLGNWEIATLCHYPSTSTQNRFFGTQNSGLDNDSKNTSPTPIIAQGIQEDGEEQDTAAPISKEEFTVPIVIEMPELDYEEHCWVEDWHKSPGDYIHQGDLLCDISTPDELFLGMQIDDEEGGIMGEIHVARGVPVADGTPLCTIYHKEGDGEANDND